MPLPNGLLTALEKTLPPNTIYSDPADCYAYGSDNSRKHHMPDGVVFATTHEQVVKIVQLGNQFNVPLITRGRGTNPVGGTIPIQGGLILSLERMNRILEMDPQNRVMTVEPGVLNATVQQTAAEHGLFWAPDPTSSAYSCIGGNLGCNAAGPRGVKYGTTRENTLGLTCVTGDGRTIKAGVYTTKGVVGYDLTRLVIGSEGTLAIITSAYLKLTPKPEGVRTIRALYRSVQGATHAVVRLMGQANTPCALEFADNNCVQIIRNIHPNYLPKDANALVMIEVDGNINLLDSIAKSIIDAATNEELCDILVAQNKLEADTLWQARKSLSQSLRQISPNKINEDIVVPVSKIPELIDYLENLSHQYQFPIVTFGHAGNGNLHVNLLVDPNDKVDGPKAKACLNAVFDKVLALRGTLSGEHGVGIEKREFITKEKDADTILLMKQIKAQFDPNGILNPGKIFP